MGKRIEADEAIPLSDEDITTLEMLDEYVGRCKAAGKKIGQSYALSTDEEFAGLTQELEERLFDFGLPFPPDLMPEETTIPEMLPKPEPASQEQLQQIFEKMMALAQVAKVGILGGIELGRRPIRRTVYLNLPEEEARQARLLGTATTLESDKPTTFRLDLTPFTTSRADGPILAEDHPLGNAMAVRIFKPDEETIGGDVRYRILPSSVSPTGEDLILEPSSVMREGEAMMWYNITAPQAEALLNLLPAV